MGGHIARSYWEGTGLGLLIGGFLLPPFAWLLDLQVSYAMLKWACENARRDLVLLMPLGSLSLLALGTWMSWTCWTKLRDAHPEGARIEDRSHLVAVSGLAMSAVFGLLILTSMVPRYVLSPCD